jgi:uncharacterized protein (TIGR03790 family)
MKVIYLKSLLILLSSGCLLSLSSRAQALVPAEVAVVANIQADHSLDLAKYYMQRRAIPKENLIIVGTSAGEAMDRHDFDKEIARPIRSTVRRLRSLRNVQCLVLIYGVPLKIKPAPLSPDGKLDNHKLATETRASVDSELALLLCEDYPLTAWVANPRFAGFQDRETPIAGDDVLMISRLDGPDSETVRRIIEDSLEAERIGLRGRAYFDARWKKPLQEHLSGYALYDNAIHLSAEQVAKTTAMPVTINSDEDLFGDTDCPETALYCGWYSLSRYVDAFDWVPGAVGFHIASDECATLKREGSQVWCKRMLEDGIAATIGPVYEPYVQGFPAPDVFFTLLLDGRLCLAECYMLSLPYLSWQMVLIGDPLYRPFATKME